MGVHQAPGHRTQRPSCSSHELEEREGGLLPARRPQGLCLAEPVSTSGKTSLEWYLSSPQVVIRTGVNSLARMKRFCLKRLPVQSQSRQKPAISVGGAKPPVQITQINSEKQPWKEEKNPKPVQILEHKSKD